MTATFNEPKYQIEASAFHCAACGGEVPCGGAYFSAVSFEAEAFRRRDFCPQCWVARFPGLARPPVRTGARTGARKGKAAEPPPVPRPPEPESSDPEIFAFWRARRPPLPEEKAVRMRFEPEVVLEFFRRLRRVAPAVERSSQGPERAAGGAATTASSGETTVPAGETAAPDAGSLAAAVGIEGAAAEPAAPTADGVDAAAGAGAPAAEGAGPAGELAVSTAESSASAAGAGAPAAESAATPPAAAAPAASSEPGAIPDSERDELRFVLSLLLVRKKVLQFVSSQTRDGAEWLKLSEKKDPGRAHWVRNPQLADARLERIKDRIGELLQMRI